MKISIIGAGRIGLPLATFLASERNEVTVYDIDKGRIDLLKKGKIPFYEPGLKLDNVQFKMLKGDIDKSDLIFVCYGPESPAGTDLYISNLVDELRGMESTLILRGTVIPGTCRKISEMMSIDVAFVPERTVEGKAVKEQKQLTKIVGATSEKAKLEVASFFRSMRCKVVEVSCIEIAETCKLIDNCHRFLNIGFTCEIQKYCDSYGIDTKEVIKAANTSYPRNHLFEPGLGSYGNCHQKDASFFVSEIQGLGLIDQALRSNDDILFGLIETVVRRSPRKVAILGTAFKGSPPTDDTRNAPASIVMSYVKARLPDTIITTFDPYAYSESETIDECVKFADVIIILTNAKAFKMNLSDLASIVMNDKALVIDPWNNINENDRSLEVVR